MGNRFSLGRKPAQQEDTQAAGNDKENDPEYWRDQARQHAQRRNGFYERSQAAYQQHNGAEAKALSLEGKKETQLMEEANRKASEAAFKLNNVSAEENVIDLHGLYVSEAERVVSKRVAQARKQRSDHLVVIVGQGHHSKDGVQRLRPAVQALCRRENIPCTENKPRDGCLWLDLPRQTFFQKLRTWCSDNFVCR